MVCGILFLEQKPGSGGDNKCDLEYITTSTDVKLDAQVLIRGDNVWQRHYLA